MHSQHELEHRSMDQRLTRSAVTKPQASDSKSAQRQADEEADEGRYEEADENLAETEAALAAAQEAQWEAVQAEQQALAEEHQTLQRLRDDMHQESGLPAHTVLRHTLYSQRGYSAFDVVLCIG